MRRPTLVALAALASAAACGSTAHARSYVAAAGNRPDVAIDSAGVVDLVWDVRSGGRSATHYCRIAWSRPGCIAGSQRVFAPVRGADDFAGPRVLAGGGIVEIVTSRCCTRARGPDGRIYPTRLFRFVSTDGGITFGPASWVGTLAPDLGVAIGQNGGVLALGSVLRGSDPVGAALQMGTPAGFPKRARRLTTKPVVSGGVGVSPAATVAAYDDDRTVYAGGAAPGSGPGLRPVALAPGGQTVVDSGPLGPDVLYRNLRSRTLVVRRYANGRFGPATTVSDPYAGEAAMAQDPDGGMHVVWDAGFDVLYRAAGPDGAFGTSRLLNATGEFFHPHIAIGATGRVAVAYDGDSDNSPIGLILLSG